MSRLAEEVSRLVRELGDAHLAALVEAYRGTGSLSAGTRAGAKAAVPVPHHDLLDRLHRRWDECEGLSGSAVALALEAAQHTRHSSDGPRVEVVVTGPGSHVAPVRLTSEVVSQLIDSATKRVTMVSYAAYGMPVVITALHSARARGVDVSLILESPAKLAGGGGAQAYAAFRVYHWPIEHRDPPEAALHAKAVIVDSRDVLLTSANMTAAAYDRNIELGVLCRGGGVAAQVQHHFDALINGGTLEPAG